MDRAAGPERVLTRPAQRLIATAAVLVVAVAGCSSHGGSPGSSAPPSPSASGKINIAAGDRGACAQLFARLQQVSGVLTASSELLANALDKQQLSQRIADEQVQLQQSADLMAQGPIPAALVDADHQIVEALRAFTDDFARAKKPAARGDFQAAADAMTDRAVVQRIVDASKTIEDACS